MPHGSRKHLTRIDPRNPLAVDTRALGRQPGSMRTDSRDVPAPADLRVGLVGVPEAADIELDLRLEAVMEGVLVSGTAYVPLAGECARCLDTFTSTLEADFQELFVYPDTRSARMSGGASGDRPDSAGEDEHYLDGDLLDLEPVLRDAIVLALPLSPLCRDDCPGLCGQCGARLADVEPGHHHDVVDPRWAALQDLYHNDNDQEG